MRTVVGLLGTGVLVAWLSWPTTEPERRERVSGPPQPPRESAPDKGNAIDPAPLLAALRSDDAPARRTAAKELAQLGADAVPGLVAILQNGTLAEQLRALGVLEKLAPHAAPAVPELLRLFDGDTRAAKAARDVLRAMGSAAAENALPTLVEWLQGADDDRARRAGWLLGDLGAAAKRAMPAILDVFRDEKRRRARGSPLIEVVEDLGPDAIEAAPAMLAFIHDMGVAKEKARRSPVLVNWLPTDYDAARALAAMGPAVVPQILASFGGSPDDAHFSYRLALREMGASAVPALVEGLEHENATVRENIAEVFDDTAHERDDVRRALEQALHDPSEGVRREAAKALRHQGEAAIPALLAALRRGNMAAATALRAHGPKAAGAIPDLVPLLGHRSDSVRKAAAATLGAMGPRAVDAVPALVRALAEKNEYAREDIAESLGRIGAPAVPAIIDALRSPEPKVRAAAARALAQIDDLDETARGALANLLASDDPDVRLRAAVALAPHDDALPALLAGLRNKKYRPRTDAAKALAGYEAHAKRVLTALFDAKRRMDAEPRAFFKDWAEREINKSITALAPHAVMTVAARLTDPNEWVRNIARQALIEAGPAVLPLLPAIWAEADETVRAETTGLLGALAKHDTTLLRRALKDPSPRVRVAAASAWWSARKDARTAVPILIAALDGDEETAQRAAYMLKDIGVHAAFAEADLRRHADSPHHMVRYYLKQLLETLETR